MVPRIVVHPFLKKWISARYARRDHEAGDELASSILASYHTQFDCGDPGNPVQEDEFYAGRVLNVPYSEFAELVYALPNFEELPIMWAAWKSEGQPTEFIVRCIEDSDIIAIDTQGYDYARYRAACKESLPVV